MPDNNYRNFLRKRVEDIDKKVGKGNFIDENGNVIGKHDGYPFYTIGQRKGLGIALGYPAYVTNIDMNKNEVTVGSFDELKRDGMYVNKLNFMKYKNISGKFNADTKIRYNDKGNPSIIEQVDDTIKVYFDENYKINKTEKLTLEFGSIFKEFLNLIREINDWNRDNIQNVINDFLKNNKIKFPILGKPIRFLLINSYQGPSISDIFVILGKKDTIDRLNQYRDN